MRFYLFISITCIATLTFGDELPEDPIGRHAVRGTAVPETHESDALKEMRAFDQSLEHATLDEVNLPSEDSAREAQSRPWLSQIKIPDGLPTHLEPRVLRYLDFYKNDRRGRAIMTSWLRAQGRFHALIQETLRRAKLPAWLEYVAMIESGFDPLDHSSAGALGLWQFMPDGGRIYGLKANFWLDERRNPDESTEAVTHYFADLEARFGGWPLALAAYNAGYGALSKAMQKYNTNDYWELCKHEDGLPWDTVLYVPKVFAVALVASNRALFGYQEVPIDPPFTYDRQLIPTSMSFHAIGRALSVSDNIIAELNPELRRGRTPPERYQARLPRGTGARFAVAYEKNREALATITVRFGERSEEIAHRYGISQKLLRSLNGIEDFTEVKPGMTVLIPEQAASRSMPAAPTCETVMVAVSNKDALVPGRKRLFYRTLPFDSTYDIASFFHVSREELARYNGLDADAKLASNMVLQVWVTPDFDASQAVLVDAEQVRVVTRGSSEFFDFVEAKKGRKRIAYQVKHGDDLRKVGVKFGLSAADLARINQFPVDRPLKAGQKVTVYVPMTREEKARAVCLLVPDKDVAEKSIDVKKPEEGSEDSPVARDEDEPDPAPTQLRDDSVSPSKSDTEPLPRLPRLPQVRGKDGQYE